MNKTIEAIAKKNKKYFEDLDANYPDRHKEIHKEPCKGCPSMQDKRAGRIDPESADIKTLPKEIIASEYLFVCYARPSKLCKGLCDNMEIDEEFIKSL